MSTSIIVKPYTRALIIALLLAYSTIIHPLEEALAADETITAAFDEFGSANISAFTLNGAASLSGNVLRITPSAYGSAGSFFWQRKVSLTNDRSFSAYFAFRIHTNLGGGADGIVFTIQSQSNNAGSSGGGIGFQGISDSFGIEFDTYDNGVGAGDPDGNHIGVDLSGSVFSAQTLSVATINGAWQLDNGTVYHAWVDYDGPSNQLEVRLNNSNSRPATAALTRTIDLSAIYPQDVYVGFTAATGGSASAHDIQKFYFNSDVIAGGITPATKTYDSAPFAVTIAADPTNIPANGSSTSQITTLVTDFDDTPLSGKTVAFSTTSGTLSTTNAVTNASGLAYTTLTSTTTVANATVRGSTEGGAFGEANVGLTNISPVITEGSSASVTMSKDGAPTPFSLTLNATDTNNQTLTWSISTQASHGTATVSGTGSSKSVSYTPTSAYVGSDSFEVTVDDGASGTDTITVNVTIQADSDGDGITDDVEQQQGSDPFDRGSFIPQRGNTICSHWNGYWNGFLNIFEQANVSTSDRFLTSTIYDWQGETLGSLSMTLSPHTQFDLLVHDLPERRSDEYGTFCTNQNGIANDVEARMVFYKLEDGSTLIDPRFDFAYSLDAESGLTGLQGVLFNTVQPSLDPADQGNVIANWLIVSNWSTTERKGTLTLFDRDGVLLTTMSLTVPAKGERHVAAHEVAANMFGLAIFEPEDNESLFGIRSIRYVYDNPYEYPSFDGVAALFGGIPSGAELATAFNTQEGSAIVEIANAGDTSTEVSVQIYNQSGESIETLTKILSSRESWHLVLDDYSAATQGLVTVDGAGAGSILAYLLQYERSASAGISNIYAIRAVQPLGSVLSGGYNTYLGQSCRLIIANTNASSQTAEITMTKRDGQSILTNPGLLSEEVTVPAKGLAEFDLCSHSEADSYGTVSVVSSNAAALSGFILRIGEGASYSFPTQLYPRQ